jgi:GT2 family glycosyltransferase
MAYQQDDKDIRKKILKYNQFCTCSVMIRKSVIDKIGPLNAKYEKVDDYELRLRSGLISKFYNIPEYLVQYRKYIGNTSTNNKNYLQMKNLHFKLTRKYYKKYPN